MSLTCKVNNIEIDLKYSNTIEENIISINSKRELFFDVYECIVNNKKIILEKVGESDLGPKVLLEVNIEGKKYSAEAILVDNGSTYVELNKENIYFIRTIPEENLPIEESNEEENIINNETSDNIEVNYENIIEHHVNNKLVFLHELEEQFEEKIVSLKDDISNKLDLFFEKLEDKKKVIIEDKLEKITSELNEKFIVLQSELHGVEDFSKKNIDNILEKKINEIDNSVSLFLEGITKEYRNKIISSDKKISHNFLELNSIKEKIKENNSSTNKKFDELNLLKEKLLEQDELILKNQELKKFINEEFQNIDSKFKNLSEEENKKYNELLAAINNKDVIEYKTILKEKIQDVELTNIKEALQEDITNALQGDIVSLKRYVEMSSGGGSIAKQFAKGGIMDGDLTVVGKLSAENYLGIPIASQDTNFLPLSGGNLTGTLSSNNTIVADTILATNILSATNLDIGFELSGFNVTGDLSASGNLSAVDIKGNKIISTGNVELGGNISASGQATLSALKINSDGTSSSDQSPFTFEVSADNNNSTTTALYIYPTDTNNHRVFFQNPAQDRNVYAVNFSGVTQIENTPAFNNLTAKSTTTNSDNFGLGTVTAGTGIRRSGTTDNFDIFVSHSSNVPDFVFHAKTGGFFSSDAQLNGTNEIMRLTNGGKLGIGTSSPNEKLTVAGNISATNTIASSAGLFTDAVGIGTTSPAAKLHVSGDSLLLDNSSAGSNTCLELKTANSAIGLLNFADPQDNNIGSIFYRHSNNSMSFNTNNATAMKIDSNGNLGIGTDSPNEKLTVAGNISANGGLSATKIIGGLNNTAFGTNATVGGGCTNIASGLRTTIGGGELNCAIGTQATVAGGRSNKAIGNKSIIGGGQANHACGNYTVVTGGSQNCTTASYATVGGGKQNKATGIYGSTIAGGYGNCATGYTATVGGGQGNCANGNHSVVGGGTGNYGTGNCSAVAGGTYNRAIGTQSFVGGGYSNKACSNHSSILGGSSNCINTGHTCSFIIGTGITSSAACTTFVNNLTSLGKLDGCSIESKNGFKIGEDAIVTYNTSFTLPLSDNGRTTLLDTTSGSIVVTVPNLETGFSNKFIKEAGAAPVVFSVGNGLSALGSYQDRNQMSIIYAQADIFYKNENYAFLGGNLE